MIGIYNFVYFLAHLSAVSRQRSKSVKKYSIGSPSTLHENEENGFVQVSVRKEALIELQRIVSGMENKTNQDSGLDIENISPNEVSTICGILATCGILN